MCELKTSDACIQAAILRSHKNGTSKLDVYSKVMCASVTQQNCTLTSRIHPILLHVDKGVRLSNFDTSFQTILKDYVQNHRPELCIVSNYIKCRLSLLLKKQQGRGIPVTTLLAEDHLAPMLQQFLLQKKAVILPGTDLVFSKDIAVEKSGGGIVFARPLICRKTKQG